MQAALLLALPPLLASPLFDIVCYCLILLLLSLFDIVIVIIVLYCYCYYCFLLFDIVIVIIVSYCLIGWLLSTWLSASPSSASPSSPLFDWLVATISYHIVMVIGVITISYWLFIGIITIIGITIISFVWLVGCYHIVMVIGVITITTVGIILAIIITTIIAKWRTPLSCPSSSTLISGIVRVLPPLPSPSE